MDTPATSRKRPASSPLNVKAFQPTCSVRSIFPPRTRRCLVPGPHPPPTMRSCFIGTGRGGLIVREIVASCVQAPPAFCTEAKVAKGGAYLRDTTVYHKLLTIHPLQANVLPPLLPKGSYIGNFHSFKCPLGSILWGCFCLAPTTTTTAMASRKL